MGGFFLFLCYNTIHHSIEWPFWHSFCAQLVRVMKSNLHCLTRATANAWKMWTPTCPCPRPVTITVTTTRVQGWTAAAAVYLAEEAYQWAPETASPSPLWSAPLNSPKTVCASVGLDMCGLVDPQKIKQATKLGAERMLEIKPDMWKKKRFN